MVVYYVDNWGNRVPERWLNDGGHEWHHRVEEVEEQQPTTVLLPDLCGHCDANLGVNRSLANEAGECPVCGGK